jgi:hypothetical protein
VPTALTVSAMSDLQRYLLEHMATLPVAVLAKYNGSSSCMRGKDYEGVTGSWPGFGADRVRGFGIVFSRANQQTACSTLAGEAGLTPHVKSR